MENTTGDVDYFIFDDSKKKIKFNDGARVAAFFVSFAVPLETTNLFLSIFFLLSLIQKGNSQ